jgi:hypothetical protein
LNPLFLALLAAMAIGNRSNTVVLGPGNSEPPDVDETDFGWYQQGLISLNRRLDAIEATLGGVAVLEIAATTYMLEKVGGERIWVSAILGVMATAIGLALFGVLGFQGDETPDLVRFDEERRSSRKEAVAHAIRSIAETYAFNNRQVRRKERLRFVSVWLTAIVATIFGLHVLEWVK